MMLEAIYLRRVEKGGVKLVVDADVLVEKYNEYFLWVTFEG
jgi:hypothetical protein